MTTTHPIKSYYSIILLIALFFLLSGINSHAQEVIQSYDSHIIIETNGSLNVTETIIVMAEGKDIKRGIYRDFPTKYKDISGNNYQVKFELLSVMRDGQTEDYHTEAISNGIRTYIGNKNHFLEHGTHTFTLQYYTTRQLGFFKKYDELYWNVTGNGWAFPIVNASANIQLPPGVSVDQIETDAYTGAVGAKGKEFATSMPDDMSILFNTTDKLPVHHGLTIVVNWPKGYITEPTQKQKINWFFQDNRATLIGLSGLTLLFVYFFLAWLKVGRDPQPGVIYPRYEPDKKHSPASMRFVKKMRYDKKNFTAALINMAVKGYLSISDTGYNFTIKKTGQQAKLSLGELAIAKNLFLNKDKITLKRSEHKSIARALVAHEKVLRRDYEKIYFQTNMPQLLPGWLISIAALVFTFLAIDTPGAKETVAFFAIWLSFWSIGVTFLSISMYRAWKNIRGFWSLFPALFSTAFATPFIIGEFTGLYLLWQNAGTGVFLSFILIIVTNVLFYNWMKAPTLKGRTLLDKIDGFKLYLDVAEADELKFKQAPALTPPILTQELFEKFLPYAIALEVETQWAKRFNSVFSQLEQQGQTTSPLWYSGKRWNSNSLSAFSSTMAGSLSSAIASSSTAPGSSSGSGGGGSSGGGGGGGGGGGW